MAVGTYFLYKVTGRSHNLITGSIIICASLGVEDQITAQEVERESLIQKLTGLVALQKKYEVSFPSNSYDGSFSLGLSRLRSLIRSATSRMLQLDLLITRRLITLVSLGLVWAYFKSSGRTSQGTVNKS